MVYPTNPMSQRYFDSLMYKKEMKTIIFLHNYACIKTFLDVLRLWTFFYNEKFIQSIQ